MTRVEQKRSGLVHLVNGEGFTLCGRWAGRRTSFRKSESVCTCVRCRESQARIIRLAREAVAA